MKYEILGTRCWTPALVNVLFDAIVGPTADLCIVVVAIESHLNEWKCYIGYGAGKDELQDQQHVAANGMPIGDKAIACAMFPNLDPEGFRY